MPHVSFYNSEDEFGDGEHLDDVSIASRILIFRLRVERSKIIGALRSGARALVTSNRSRL
jgi:hypothetical protein